MNKRTRKKWLKQHNKYINPRETWYLDITIAEFILPRLKLFKKLNNGYPGIDEMYTPEKWDEALDKMIIAFQYISEDDAWWFGNPEYDYTSGLHMRSIHTDSINCDGITIDEDDWVAEVRKKQDKENLRRREVIKEGMELFAKWHYHLWW